MIMQCSLPGEEIIQGGLQRSRRVRGDGAGVRSWHDALAHCYIAIRTSWNDRRHMLKVGMLHAKWLKDRISYKIFIACFCYLLDHQAEQVISRITIRKGCAWFKCQRHRAEQRYHF